MNKKNKQVVNRKKQEKRKNPKRRKNLIKRHQLNKGNLIVCHEEKVNKYF